MNEWLIDWLIEIGHSDDNTDWFSYDNFHQNSEWLEILAVPMSAKLIISYTYSICIFWTLNCVFELDNFTVSCVTATLLVVLAVKAAT